jgi:excisionase family DNA binding protein
MSKRRPNYLRAQIHRSYTVEDVARRFGIHKNTVRAWVKTGGLPTCDTRRPTLILGRDLRAFLLERRTKNKRPCKPGEIYCVRCRAPQRPAGEMADYQPITASQGMLSGICPACGAMIYRRASRLKLPEIQGNLDIRITEAERRVSNSNLPIVNSDFNQG